MTTNGNDLVARFITETTWDRLPPAVQGQARRALLDTLGAALAGTQTPISRIASQAAVTIWPGDEATLLLKGRRASAVGAAFANGSAANAIDIDDCAIYTKGHPGAQLFPTALAVVESRGMSGAALLAALVVGYEVAHRAARIWHATREMYQACGSWGSVACAAVAAHLMNLPPEQVGHALGIAEYHAPNLPMMRDIDHPAMVKHGIGWGAMNGIVSALLASGGYTGIPSLFGLEEYHDWVSDIGQQYIMADGLAWKRYACCAWDHAAMLGAQRLVREHSVRLEDIARIRVEGFHETVRLGVKLPTTTEEAQFSLAWPLAALLLDGEVGPEQMLERRFDDPALREVAGRIELVESEVLNDLHRLALAADPRGKYASVVKIVLQDGRVLDSGIVEGEIGYPQNVWDEASLESKFRWLAGSVLDEARIEQVVEMVWQLDRVPDVRALTRLIA